MDINTHYVNDSFKYSGSVWVVGAVIVEQDIDELIYMVYRYK